MSHVCEDGPDQIRGRCSPVTGLGENGSMDLHLNGNVVPIAGGTDRLGAALANRRVETRPRPRSVEGIPAGLPPPCSGCITPPLVPLRRRPSLLAFLTLRGSLMLPLPGEAASTAW